MLKHQEVHASFEIWPERGELYQSLLQKLEGLGSKPVPVGDVHLSVASELDMRVFSIAFAGNKEISPVADMKIWPRLGLEALVQFGGDAWSELSQRQVEELTRRIVLPFTGTCFFTPINIDPQCPAILRCVLSNFELPSVEGR
jgi:hypothetical protein